MTTRTDIVVDFKRSPRIAEIAVGSVEIIMQDYVDTIRPIESSFTAMSHPYLLNAEGKAVLGGGKLTGITNTEQDLKLAFNPDTTPAETGTVTTGSSPPTPTGEISFTDTAALFETNGVARGSMVVNFTDQSIADVIEVLSETSLTTKTLVNGIGNTFDVLDVYHVFNITQVTATGGNLVGVDSVGDPANAVLPTAFTQVINESDVSAALISGTGVTQGDKDDIENQIFDRIVEAGFSFEALIRLMASNAAANVVQQLDGSYVIRDINDTKDRITGDDAVNGGRTISATDGT